MSTTPAASRRSTKRSTGTPWVREMGRVGRRAGGPPASWSALRRDVPEVRVGVVRLLDDRDVRAGRVVALEAVPGVEPGLVDHVLVQLLRRVGRLLLGA